MKIYLVGGSVRDRLLKIPHTEKDYVVVGSTPEEMIKLGYRPVGKDFPVFLHPKTHEEYALARTERKNGKGYTQFVFYASPDVTLEQDLQRRDLTLNAIAMDENNNLIDPFNGQVDIKNKILKHVSEAFIEDPVRILRVGRFLAKLAYLGFTVSPETQHLMQEMVKNGEVDALVPDRVWQECDRALGEKNPEKFFEVLDHCGALVKLFPNISLPLVFKGSKNSQRFASVFLAKTESDIESFSEQYPVPVYYRDLAFLANKYQSFLKKKLFKADEMINFFEGADAYRRSERFYDLLEMFEENESIQSLKRVFENTKNLDIRPLQQKGFVGKALGEAIHEARIIEAEEMQVRGKH